MFQSPALGRIRSLAIAPDGRYLAAGMERDKVAHVYDLSNWVEVLQVPHKSIIYCVAFSPDSRYFGSASRDKTVPIYDLASKRVQNLGHQENVFAIAFSADNNFVATGGLGQDSARF